MALASLAFPHQGQRWLRDPGACESGKVDMGYSV
jgi:hypothetical protein